ncbi:2OG-Fe(II) oxygenase [Vitreimonas flagellata]|uniref:2OG-Fe(II) oxygenase n=1 Tax=Vitreimonas flagellata TaxID=2560861 RepID=UPI001430529E|nr:2OG-Fe(II) oxygenase family protein [Vitreimonas flagellata]
MMQLRLNPALDPAHYASIFRQEKCVQVPNLFETAVANEIERVIASVPWRLICQDDSGQNVLLKPEELASLTPQEKQSLDAGIRERAAQSIGYTYFMYPMIMARLQAWDPGHPIHALTDFLNAPEFLNFARALISYPKLTKVDVHASLYGPGHYLTTHKDDDSAVHGRAAYTIGFSRDWRADWGGLLVFVDDAGDIRRGFIPRFNTLTVFDGQQAHTVTAISQFTPKPRLSMAGWFRDDAVGG